MSALVKQLVCILLLGGVVLLRNRDADSPTLEEKESLKRYGFYLREVSKKSGIDFTHEAPAKLDGKLDHIMPIIASMGASASVVDYDRDGWLDIYVVNSREGSKNRLYRNKGDGTFEEVAEKLGVADLNKDGTGVSMGAVWGDYDNDGYEDLFLAGYWRDEINLWGIPNTRIMPESFEFANNGGRKYLLRGKGDGTFEDVTEKAGIKSNRWTLAVAAGHLAGGRYPDLFLANDYGVSEVYANKGGKEFVEIGKNCEIGSRPKSGMNASFGDVFNRGQFAVYVSWRRWKRSCACSRTSIRSTTPCSSSARLPT